MTAVLRRGPLTDRLLAELAAAGKPVGDARAPVDPHGWKGQAGAPGSEFLEYAVLLPKTATSSTGPIGAPQASWQLPYQIWTYGVTRAQVENLADRLRTALGGLRREVLDLGGVRHKIQQVRTESIGEPARYGGSADPSYYAQADTVSIWITKE